MADTLGAGLHDHGAHSMTYAGAFSLRPPRSAARVFRAPVVQGAAPSHKADH
jgi:hypothetical protein